MIDTDSLLSSVDLLGLAERDAALRHVASTNGGEYAGPCPFCGGRDRFRVQPNASPRPIWYCRQCGGGRWHDALDYVARRESLDLKRADDFRRACELLGGAAEALPHRERPPAPPAPDAGPPSAEWQAAARHVIEESVTALWADTGARARAWLNARGLTDKTLRRWQIGYSPTARRIAGLWVWDGVTIPHEIGGVLWAINVRRPDRYLKVNPDEDKYKMVSGSKRGLFGADTLRGHSIAVICEGEFDALLLHQQAGDLVGVATLGAAGKGLNVARWGEYLLPLRRLLLAYDMDDAGKKGAAKLAGLTARARRLTLPVLPGVKDLTDFHKAGGNLRDWLAFELARLELTLPHAVTPVTSLGGNTVTSADCYDIATQESPYPPLDPAVLAEHMAALPELPPRTARDWERVTAIYDVTQVGELRNVIHRSAWRDGDASIGRELVTWRRPCGECHGMTGGDVTSFSANTVTSAGMTLPPDDDPGVWGAIMAEESAALAFADGG